MPPLVLLMERMLLVSTWMFLAFAEANWSPQKRRGPAWRSRNDIAVLMGSALSATLNSNSVSCINVCWHMVVKFLGRRTASRISPALRRSRCATCFGRVNDALGFCLCERVPMGDGGAVISTARVRDGGEYRMTGPSHGWTMLGKIYINDSLLYGSIRTIYTEMFS